MERYRAPLWLGGSGPLGSHLQTIWPPLFARSHHGPRPPYRRERWATPDGDFVDVDWLDGPAIPIAAPAATATATTAPAATAAPGPRPLLVLFHGLEGSSSSSYALAFADWARRQGWAFAVPHFRGCSGQPNLAPRSYHSGDFEEVGWMLQQAARQHAGPLVAVGVSLGGNALMRWAEEAGEQAATRVRAVAAVCSPLDLAAAGHALSRGLNLRLYTRMFLRTLKPKALAQLQRHPGLFNAQALQAARNLYEYDNVYTAPVHGFRHTEDYWARASAKPQLRRIRVPALLLNTGNDPFIPRRSLPGPQDIGPALTLWQPRTGGHVGLPAGRWPPGHVLTLPQAVGTWLAQRL